MKSTVSLLPQGILFFFPNSFQIHIQGKKGTFSSLCTELCKESRGLVSFGDILGPIRKVESQKSLLRLCTNISNPYLLYSERR